MKKVIIIFSLIIFSSLTTPAQTLKELNEQVIYYYNQGDYNTAISFAEKALEQCRREFGEEHKNYGTTLNNLAKLYEITDRYEDALLLAIEALDNTERKLGKDHSSYSFKLNNLVLLYRKMGRHEKAVPLAIEALENTEKVLGKNNLEYAKSLNSLAELYRELDRYANALPLYKKALENIEMTLGKNHSNYNTILNNIARCYFNIGMYEEAFPLVIEALENTEKILGKNNLEYAKSLNSLAELYRQTGRYENALPLYFETLEITEKTLGKDHLNYGIVLSNLAVLYTDLGRYEEAVPLYLQTLKNFEKILGKNHSNYGIILSNLANVYQFEGRYEEALSLYLEALENTEKNFGKDHSSYSIKLNNLVLLYRKMGRYEEALPLAIEALEITEKVFGKNHPEYGKRLNNLAILYESMGRYEESLPLYIEALGNIEKTLSKDHSHYGSSLINLAGLFESMMRYEDALPLYVEANQYIHNQIKSIFSFSSEKEKKVFLKTTNYNFDTYQSFNYKTDGQFQSFKSMLYNNQLILKGLLLNSSKNMLQVINESGNKETVELYNKWLRIKRRLAGEYSKPVTERVNYIDSLETKSNQLERELVSISNEFMSEKEKQNVIWEDIKRNLGSKEIAIEFSHFRYSSKGWTDSTLYAAYIISANSEYPEAVYLFEEKELNKILKQNSLNNLYTSRGAKITSTTSYRDDGGLYEKIIGPLEPYLQDKEKIYYSTSGKLHQVSFAALADKEGKLLSENFDLVQLNSTGKLALINESPSKEPALLAGGIKFEYIPNDDNSFDSTTLYAYNILENEDIKRSQSSYTRGEAWNYLPGTEKEVNKLSDIYEQYNISIQTVTGSFATEEYIKSLDGKSPKVLHLATHGFFFEDPKKNYDEISTLSLNKEPAYKLSEDPLMRSGLILAGGNYAWENGSNPYEKEDGILTAYEISNLNLMNTDLVVLSACETGLGDIDGSEGVYGLQRAFRMAGVENIIMSLWEVPDKETVEFMETFYTKWLNGEDIIKAFNNTQKIMSTKYRDEPEKWAAFILLQ